MMTAVRDAFRELTIEHKNSEAWLKWLRSLHISPERLVWDGGWVERRDNRVLYLVHDERDGEPIHAQQTLSLNSEPPGFPD